MNKPVDPVAQINDQVRADRLGLLFRQSFIATFGSMIAACILGWLHWDLADHDTIRLWLTALGGSTVLRIAMFAAYFRTHPGPSRLPHWELVYWVTLIVSAGIWGFGAWAVMPKDNLLSQTITLLFTIGMAGSAVSTYSAYRSMTLTAIGLVLLPCTLWLLFQASATQRGLASAALLFSVSVIRATGDLAQTLQTALRLTHELQLAHHIASSAASTDELTGIYNRRAFFERAHQLFSYCKRHQRPLYALVVDIDHFKQINDTYGHQAGDNVLRMVGGLLRGSFRDADVYGRLGGEEFAVLLADASADMALQIAEKLRASLAQLELDLGGQPTLHLSASIGIASTVPPVDDVHALLKLADQAMYRAKAAGRNQVASHQGAA